MKRLLLILCVLLLVGCGEKSTLTDTEQSDVQLETGRYGTTEPITREQVAKMLAMSKYNLEEIEKMEKTLSLTDVNQTLWCYKYINSAVKADLISGTEENTFLPQYYLSLEQAQFILNNFTDNLKLEYVNEDRKKPIAYSMWVDAFEAGLKKQGQANIVEEKLVILADGEDIKQLEDRFVMTTKGLKSIEGTNISNLKYKELKVLSKDNEILAIKEITLNNPVITVAVKEVGEDCITCNSCGCNLVFKGKILSVNSGDKIDMEIQGLNIINIIKNYNMEDNNEQN